MTEKRKYTEVLASIETHITYINTHLRNLDGHLEKINTTNLAQEVKILRNKDRIGLIYKIGGGLITILVTALILSLFGVY